MTDGESEEDYPISPPRAPEQFQNPDAWTPGRRGRNRGLASGQLPAWDASKTTWSYSPEPFEEREGAPRVAVSGVRHHLCQVAVPVDGAEQLELEFIDGADEIRERVRAVDEDGHSAHRRTIADADGHRPGQRHVVVPAITGKADRLAPGRLIVAIGDEAVGEHRAAPQLDRGVLQSGRQ